MKRKTTKIISRIIAVGVIASTILSMVALSGCGKKEDIEVDEVIESNSSLPETLTEETKIEQTPPIPPPSSTKAPSYDELKQKEEETLKDLIGYYTDFENYVFILEEAGGTLTGQEIFKGFTDFYLKDGNIIFKNESIPYRKTGEILYLTLDKTVIPLKQVSRDEAYKFSDELTKIPTENPFDIFEETEESESSASTEEISSTTQSDHDPGTRIPALLGTWKTSDGNRIFSMQEYGSFLETFYYEDGSVTNKTRLCVIDRDLIQCFGGITYRFYITDSEDEQIFLELENIDTNEVVTFQKVIE